MIVTELYDGQGLGNQLWSYVVTRTIALDKGFEFGIMNPNKFKGKDFMNLNFGRSVYGGFGPEGGPPDELPNGIENYYVEKDTWHQKYKCDIRDYDTEVLNISDNTKIEGYFQSENFITHRQSEIREWLKVKPESDCYDFSDENICILNIRGGEYKFHPYLLLTKKYWTHAIDNMLEINKKLNFIIITDDVPYAKKLFPNYLTLHFDVGKDYSIIKNAKYLIMSNSSFSFFPAWTSVTLKYVIAPKYWARHNVSDGYWACAFNIYRNWMWQDRNGQLQTYDLVKSEYEEYSVMNKINDFGRRPPLQPQTLVKQYINTCFNIAIKVKRKLYD